jgi:hypothetical protein
MLATALLLGGGSLAFGAYLSAKVPDTVVRDYFAAIQRGDAPAALGYGDVPAGNHGLLTSEVLAAQQEVAPMTDIAVTGWQTADDGTGRVAVAYTLRFPSGPAKVTDSVPVVLRDNEWRLAASAIDVHLGRASGVERATIAGAAVPDGEYDVFPGVLPVRYDTPNLELGPGSRIVRFAEPGTLPQVTVDAVVSAAGRRAIAAAVRQALATCLAGKAPDEVLCPVPQPGFDVPGSLRGTVIGPLSSDVTMIVVTAEGRVDIEGATPVAATYGQLDQNDIAVSTQAHVVGVKGHCNAADPTKITWDAS